MIISTSIILILVALLVGFYMAWNIGANDVANSMSTAVGAKAITLKQAVVIAAVLEAAGAILVGSSVADTVKKGVIDPQVFGPSLFILGSLSAILAASIWVTISTWKEMPISTTHSIIGSLIGFGIISGSMGLVPGGVGVVGWGKVGHIALGWVISPFMAALIAYIVFRIIVRLMFENERPDEAARKRSPIFLGATIFLVVISFLLKTPFGKSLGVADNVPMALGIALLAAIASSYLGYIFLILPAIAKAKDTDGDYARVEIVFRRLQIITSCYVAFAHGANDVANAIGPVAGVIQASQGTMEAKVAIPLYL
ncbi:MAG: inorganic phosphate transporter, partial [Thermoplasmata archaeon]|nr:inorganic phosphate transporter [Thermoplasmata archaeon]